MEVTFELMEECERFSLAEGEKLAAFPKHFYGLEPIKPAQPGGRG